MNSVPSSKLLPAITDTPFGTAVRVSSANGSLSKLQTEYCTYINEMVLCRHTASSTPSSAGASASKAIVSLKGVYRPSLIFGCNIDMAVRCITHLVCE